MVTAPNIVYTPFVIVTAFAYYKITKSSDYYQAKPAPINVAYTNRSGTLASLSSSSKLTSVQHSLNFCLPAASQLPHPKGMCLNAALNKIAFKSHRTKQVKSQ
jgi:hypothetical protein